MSEALNHCPRCKGQLVRGQAFQNTIRYGVLDFPGTKPGDLVGQTFDEGGPARLVDVLKCQSCGYSRTV